MSKVLVTGANGFIGKHVVAYLSKRGHTVFTLNSRLSDIDGIELEVHNVDPDVIIHLAAISTPKNGRKDWPKIIDTNIAGTYNLINAAPPKSRFIFASTITVYGTKTTLLAPDENTVHRPTSMYAASKSAAENIINVFSAAKQITPIHLRLCAVIGSDMTHGAIYDFIKKIRTNDNTISVLGNSPGSTKPYIHVDDVCNAIQLSIIRKKASGAYNICADDCMSIKTIINMMMGKLNHIKEIIWNGDNFLGDNLSLDALNKKAKLQLGWKPQYPGSLQAIQRVLQDIKNA
jgi:UDP-glucose 4-epimerase